MDEEPVDSGLDAAATAAGRAMVMAAAVAAEQVSRLVRAQRERARLDDVYRAQQLHSRYAAERELARVALTAGDQRWLAQAARGDVEQLVATTSTWASLEPEEFGPRLQRLREEVTRTRPHDAEEIITATNPAAASSAARSGTGPPAERTGQDTHDAVDETAAAVVALTAGEDARRDAEEDLPATSTRDTGLLEDEPTYDTVARRAAVYQRAVAAGTTPEVAAGRVRAATAQARPVGEPGRGSRATPPVLSARSRSRGAARTGRPATELPHDR